jgi:sugar lactone lactonase YvrE
MNQIKLVYAIAAIGGTLFLSCSKKDSGAVSVTVTTFAGSGEQGSANGTGGASSFFEPKGMAFDASGNLYVADDYNNEIRKITPGGVVGVFAGTGIAGSDDGPADKSSFQYPTGIAIDASGNMYVADDGNNLIRKITPGGEVSTLAGSGSSGSDDGVGKQASFFRPLGVAVDASGNVYVADYQNCLIRKIDPNGVVTTLAGNKNIGAANGTGTNASFNFPAGVATDKNGNVYVADANGCLIRKINAAGVVTTLAGSGMPGKDDGVGVSASFFAPQGITVDKAGNIYVADGGNDLIRKITPDGVVTTIAGSGTPGFSNGTGISTSFKGPDALIVDASGNSLYIADTFNNLIRKIVLR